MQLRRPAAWACDMPRRSMRYALGWFGDPKEPVMQLLCIEIQVDATVKYQPDLETGRALQRCIRTTDDAQGADTLAVCPCRGQRAFLATAIGWENR